MKRPVTWKEVAMAMWRLVNAKQYKIRKLERKLKRKIMNKRTTLIAMILAVALSLSARAEDTNVVSTKDLTDNATPVASNAPPVAVISSNTPIASIPKVNFSPVDKASEYLVQNGVVSAGAGININRKMGPTISEGVRILGNSESNTNRWAFGAEHTSFFQSDKTEMELGVFYSLSLQSAPAWTKKFLLVTKLPRELKMTIGIDLPVEAYYRGFRDFDWGQTMAHAGAGWKW